MTLTLSELLGQCLFMKKQIEHPRFCDKLRNT